MDQTFRFLFTAYCFKIQYFLHTFQRFYFVIFVFSCFVNTRNTYNTFIVITVEIEKIFVISADRLMSQESEQILNVFFGCFYVFKRKYIILIKVQLMINFFKSLQNLHRVFDFILYCCILFILFLFLISFKLRSLFFQRFRNRIQTGWFLGSLHSAHTSCFGCEQHNINNCYFNISQIKTYLIINLSLKIQYIQIAACHIIIMDSVGVFVYGDIGRSPRMQNHALELSKQYKVNFFGYFQTSPKSEILQNSNIKMIDLQIKNILALKKILYYLYAVIRIILQILQIIYLLGFKYRNLKFVLVQNPPSIPNLFAIWLTSFISKYQIFIDFHNYGYTILNLTIKNRFMIKAATLYQKNFSKRANGFLCVSNMMKKDLYTNWGIQAITLYDRPLQIKVKDLDRDLFLKKYNQNKVESNQLLLVSSTSWTKDQDFSLLIDALQLYNNNSKTKMFIRTFITGKGPQKERYLKQIDQKKQRWTKISITAIWLEADDYPLLLSICDLGVCLHYSSSGLDLPMKVIDMFGAGIPVLARNFPALPELVKDGQTGFIFESKEQLEKQFVQITNNISIIKSLKKSLQKQAAWTWKQQWHKKFPQMIKSNQ